MKHILNLDLPNSNRRRKNIEYEIDNNGCWNCVSHSKLASSTSNSFHAYPRISINRKHWSIHRLVYHILVAPLQPGLVIRHTCDNPSCINPNHLMQGTVSENNKDVYARGRRCLKGENANNNKITEEDARAIKYGPGTYSELSNKYKLSPVHVYRIKKGLRWPHI